MRRDPFDDHGSWYVEVTQLQWQRAVVRGGLIAWPLSYSENSSPAHHSKGQTMILIPRYDLPNWSKYQGNLEPWAFVRWHNVPQYQRPLQSLVWGWLFLSWIDDTDVYIQNSKLSSPEYFYSWWIHTDEDGLSWGLPFAFCLLGSWWWSSCNNWWERLAWNHWLFLVWWSLVPKLWRNCWDNLE